MGFCCKWFLTQKEEAGTLCADPQSCPPLLPIHALCRTSPKQAESLIFFLSIRWKALIPKVLSNLWVEGSSCLQPAWSLQCSYSVGARHRAGPCKEGGLHWAGAPTAQCFAGKANRLPIKICASIQKCRCNQTRLTKDLPALSVSASKHDPVLPWQNVLEDQKLNLNRINMRTNLCPANSFACNLFLLSRHVSTGSVCLKAIVTVVFLAENVEVIRRKLTRTHPCLKGWGSEISNTFFSIEVLYRESLWSTFQRAVVSQRWQCLLFQRRLCVMYHSEILSASLEMWRHFHS